MATEIEHKFLVIDDCYKALALCQLDIKQGFLSRDAERTVRVRICGEKAFLTIKGKGEGGAAHPEFEYGIPIDDARQLMVICQPPIIEKTRYVVMHEGNRWEVDEFHGVMQGLQLAELEVPSEDYRFALPPFAGREVTGDPRYYNSQMGINAKQ